MTIPRYAGLIRYWNKNPPLNLMVAAYLGVGKETKKTESNADEFFAMAQELSKPNQ